MNWIPVAERLPDEGQDVLVYSPKGVFKDPVMCTVSLQKASYLERGYTWDASGFGGADCEFDFDENNITHWMPLPELPK